MKTTIEEIARFDPQITEHWNEFRSLHAFLGKPQFFKDKRDGEIYVKVDGAKYRYGWMHGKLTFVQV